MGTQGQVLRHFCHITPWTSGDLCSPRDVRFDLVGSQDHPRRPRTNQRPPCRWVCRTRCWPGHLGRKGLVTLRPH